MVDSAELHKLQIIFYKFLIRRVFVLDQTAFERGFSLQSEGYESFLNTAKSLLIMVFSEDIVKLINIVCELIQLLPSI